MPSVSQDVNNFVSGRTSCSTFLSHYGPVMTGTVAFEMVGPKKTKQNKQK